MNSTVRNVLLGWEGRRETSALFRFMAIVLLVGSSTVHAAFECPEGQTLQGYIPNNAQLNTDNSIRKGECRKPSAQVVQPSSCYTEGQVATPDGQGTAKWRSSILSQSTDNSGTLKILVRRELQNCAPPGGCGPWTLVEDQQDEWYNPVCSAGNQCSSDAGVPHTLGGNPAGTACFNGCKVKAKAGGVGIGICFGSTCNTPVGGNGDYVGTGEVCPAGGTALSSDEKCQTVNGKSVCTSPDKPNCIKVNGVSSCFSSAGDICDTPDCFAGGEEFLKRPDGSEIAKETTGTPPAPDNGTPGQRAEPDMQIGVTQGTNGDGTWGGTGTSGGGTGTTGRYDWWSPATAGNSTTNDEDECDPQTENCEGEGEGECGEEGQPACEEEDMPDPNDWDAPDFDQDEARQKLEEAARNNPLANIDFGNVAPSFNGSGGCQSISYPFFGGKTIVLPGPQGCGFLSVLKTILAWFLAVATAWTCFQRFTETI